MEFKKIDVLNALKKVNIDNGPSASDVKLNRQDVINNLGKACPKPTSKTPDKVDQMAIIKKMNTDLADPAKSIKFESVWKPATTTVKAITQRILTEASAIPNNSPNAFRLDLKSIVLDRFHSKFTVNRQNNIVTVELIYPNANNKITVKLNIDGVDDTVYEVGLEDQQYTNNFGASIIKSIDTILAKKSEQSPSFSTPSQFSNPEVSVSGFSPNWVQAGYTMESDARHMAALMTLVEQDDTKLDEGDESADADPTADPTGDAGDVNAEAGGEFGASDFAAEGGDMGGGMDIGAGGAGMDMGGGAGGEADPNAVNADEGSVGLENNDEFVEFEPYALEHFSTEKNGIIDVLTDIVADATTKGENASKGVVLTSEMAKNGMPGLNTRPAKEIITAFLELYPKLNTQIKLSDMETLAQKLENRPSPSEFNHFIEGFITQINGGHADTDVMQLPDAPQPPMGGEQPSTGGEVPNEFGDFIDTANNMGGAPAPEGGELPQEGEDEDVQNTLRKAAELETGAGPELNEYPNV